MEETFATLRKISLKLNPEKCVFGVPSGKLLGFFLSHWGIEANPDKIKAIEHIQAPKTVKDVRCLTRCVADRAVEWTPEADAALQDLKTYLSSVPTLGAPKPQEPLLLYLAATNQVVSAVLVAQREADEAAAATTVPSSGNPSR